MRRIVEQNFDSKTVKKWKYDIQQTRKKLFSNKIRVRSILETFTGKSFSDNEQNND